jgi:hypothetical protein
MLILEALALALVAFYLILLVRGSARKKRVIIRCVLIAAAGWTTEETCILAYKFYQYSSSWYLTIGHVPVLIAVVWPVVIQSAWDFALQLTSPGVKVQLYASAAIVLTDALFIEPVAVSAGLWSWNVPGIFNVPPVGILGWACFAFLCIRVFYIENSNTDRWVVWLMGAVAVVLGTHLLVVCTWWGVFRWFNAAVNPMFTAGTTWGFSLLLTWQILKRRTKLCVNKKTLLLRLPAAVFIFSLLTLDDGPSGYLVFYAAAFALPYLILMTQ